MSFKYLPLSKLKSYNFEYIIITLSAISKIDRLKYSFKCNNTFDLRIYEFNENVKSLKKILKYLPNSKIIIVSNPVDELVTFLSKNTTLDVIGFGISLDALRYSNYFNKKINCIGLHGFSIPLNILKNESSFLKLHSKVDLKLLNYFKKNGINYEVVSNEFKIFFDKLNSNKQNTLYVSKYLLKEALGIKDLSLSLPYQVKDGNILSLKKIKLNTIEKNIIKNFYLPNFPGLSKTIDL